MADGAKVTSRELYAALRAVLAPVMKANRFTAMKAGRLGWQRQGSRGSLSVWFQCDKWGWDALWGSTFTLEFQLTPAPGDAMRLEGRFERIGYVLEGFPALEELRVRNNAVIARLPGTTLGHAPADSRREIDPQPAVYGRDLWLAYHDIHDARAWALYFGENLLAFIAIFEGEARSAEGLARARFNAMMGRVQAERDGAAKAAILEGYVKAEPDAYFRASAQQWLGVLQRLRH
jgi:hypothetical protein